MLANANDTSDGLVFYTSFRNNLIPEVGPAFNANRHCSLIFDSELGRNVMQLAEGGYLTFPTNSRLPINDSPFSLAVKAKVLEADDGFVLFGWGSTPYSPTVAVLAFDDVGLGFRNWGAVTVGQFTEVDTWHHYTVTYDKHTVVFYVDGAPVVASELSSPLTTGNVTGSFGTWWSGYACSCMCANACIYNKALDSSEVANLAAEP